MAFYKLVLGATIVLFGNRAAAQSFADITGQWVNANDSSEHLTIGMNGDFRLITHDVFNNEYNRFVGHWMYRHTLKRNFFLFPEHLPRRYYVVKKRGVLGYTLNERKGPVVYARRALLPGEALPSVGRADTAQNDRTEY